MDYNSIMLQLLQIQVSNLYQETLIGLSDQVRRYVFQDRVVGLVNVGINSCLCL